MARPLSDIEKARRKKKREKTEKAAKTAAAKSPQFYLGVKFEGGVLTMDAGVMRGVRVSVRVENLSDHQSHDALVLIEAFRSIAEQLGFVPMTGPPAA